MLAGPRVLLLVELRELSSRLSRTGFLSGWLQDPTFDQHAFGDTVEQPWYCEYAFQFV